MNNRHMASYKGRRILFIRVGWMEYYGYKPGLVELLQGGGKFNYQEIGSEVNNFKLQNELFYGFAETPATNTGYNLKRIDPHYNGVEKMDNVLVIIVATNPVEGQQRIIGFYNNATVFNRLVEDDDYFRNSHNVIAKAKESALIPWEDRAFPIPSGTGAMGRANVFYLYDSKYKLREDQWIEDAISYVDNYSGENLIIESDIGGSKEGANGGQNDIDDGSKINEFTTNVITHNEKHKFLSDKNKENIKVFILDSDIRRHFNNQSSSCLLATIKTLLKIDGLKRISLTAFCSNKPYFVETGLLDQIKEHNKSVEYRFLFPVPQGLSKEFAAELKTIVADNLSLRQFGEAYQHTRVHSKVFIAEFEDFYFSIVGSSNATGAGLLSNIEYNVLFKTNDKEKDAPLEWFNEYWSRSEELDPESFFSEQLITVDEGDINPGEAKKELLPFQKDAQEKLSAHFSKYLSQGFNLNDRGRGFLVLPTGAGKTFTTLDWIFREVFSDNNQYKKVLWVSHRHELLLQAATEARLVKKIQNKNKIVINEIYGRAQTSKPNYSFGNLFFTSNIISHNYLDKFSKINFDLVVVDEAHRSSKSTKYYGTILEELKYKSLLGLTATPYRGNASDQEFLDYFYRKTGTINPEIVYQKIREELKNNVHTGYKQLFSNPVIERIKTHFTASFGDQLQFESQIYKFNNEHRNKIIVDTYFEYKHKFKRAIIFAVNTDHANKLATLINSRAKGECQAFHNGIIPLDSRAINFAGYSNEFMSLFDRTKIVNLFKKGAINVLSTVQLLIEGFDEPQVDALFMACPTYSTLKLTQMLGRGLRGLAVGGTEECIIFDFVDQVNFHQGQNIKLQKASDIDFARMEDYMLQ